MVKKIISFLCSFLLLFSLIPCDVFADDVLDVCPNCGERTYSTWRDVSISVSEALGLPFSIKAKSCSKCHYQYYDWNLFGFADYHDYVGDESLIINYLRQWADKILGKDASASKFEAGGGSASPGGVGRRPSGYVSEGVPNYNSSGAITIMVEPYALGATNYGNFTRNSSDFSVYHLGSSGSGANYPNDYWYGAIYKFIAPVTGLYYVGSFLSEYDFGYFEYFKTGGNNWYKQLLTFKPSKTYQFSSKFNKGEECYFIYCISTKYSTFSGSAYRFKLNSIPIFIDSLDDSDVTNQTTITINNNTWNGNIYVDNTNKLTYIYPQYTVNNETKISNNPIIYNEETKQYYTYDQTTNNYYYITYNAPTASPSPDPSPSPTPTPSSSPDPGGSGGGDNPSGGGSGGDGSGGGSGDTPSGSGSSWWEKLLDKLGSALIDGLLDAIKGILKLLFDLFSAILGWIIWLCSKVFDLFPFLPPGVGALLVGGVVVCFILAFIKFIRG